MRTEPEMPGAEGTLSSFVRSVGARSISSAFALFPVIVIAMILGTLIDGAFLTKDNLINILQQSSVLAILTVGEALILLAGRFDLSIESTVGLSAMVGAWLVAPAAIGGSGFDLPPAIGILGMLAVGVAVGCVNAFLVVKMRLNAFIVTLGMLILLRGLTLGVTNGQALYELPEPITYLGQASWLGVPASVWLAGVIFTTAALILRYHKVGRMIYAVGGNADAARAAGIRVERVLAGVFIVASVLAAVAGLILAGRIGSVTATQGQNLIFTVFASAVIGGISLSGGRGTLLGALAGVVLLGIISNILTLAQIEAFWIEATYGAIIVLALLLLRFTGSDPAEE